MLSVIIPTFNELKHNYLERILSLLSNFDCEIIVVDNNSTDGTYETLSKFNVRIFTTNTTSRAERLNIGIENAKGDMILLHHPRSILTSEGLNYLICNEHSLDWGAFTHQFDHSNSLLAFTSWYSNAMRGDVKNIYYLDHCLYVKKDLLLKVGKLPKIDIFEDTELCKRLKKMKRPRRLPFVCTTSAVRFKKNGIIKQCYINQKMKFYYFFNLDHKFINKQYDNLELNSDYERDN